MAPSLSKTISKSLGSLGKKTLVSSPDKLILSNKYFLWAVLAFALLNLLYMAVDRDYLSIVVFVFVGFLTSFFSKNMVVILLVAIVVGNVIRFGARSLREGMQEGAEDEEEEKEKEGLEEEEKEEEGLEDKATEEEEEMEETKKKEGLSNKKKIGYLPELNPLYQDMFVREYLEFIAGMHQIGNPKQRIEEVIQLTGLTLESNKLIEQLSKGYKQRVGLAAALIHDPEVLILDEPTTGLDPNQIIEIREVIKKLGKQKTILFSTHILQEVEALCDRVIIIHKGKIVADAPLQELLDSPLPETANIVSLQPQARSLEHVFRTLTGSAN